VVPTSQAANTCVLVGAGGGHAPLLQTSTKRLAADVKASAAQSTKVISDPLEAPDKLNENTGKNRFAAVMLRMCGCC
jgi:hypothetical protein